jgi:nucleotidyltransferase substrate binding protein (TIGR01987 family)
MDELRKMEDIRWEQRFRNFSKAFSLLEEAVLRSRQASLNDLEKQGLIQRFEFTHELAWKVMKDFLEYKGKSSIIGSRDATREAFNSEIIEDGESWMEMIISRNLSSHTYDEEAIDDIATKIEHIYYPLFLSFKEKMDSIKG